MRRYRLYIFDLDGVLYFGETAVPGAAEVLRELRKTASVRFLTNNATKTRQQFAEKLTRLGFEASPDEIASSAWGAANHIAGCSAYVIGEDGLREELGATGCTITHDNPDWVVVGACWSFTYEMFDIAQRLIRSGAKYLATNLDKTYPIEGGVKPGAGAIVAAVSAACGREPDVVIGKPEPTLVQGLVHRAGVSARETLVVGDQLDTDVAAANDAGCDSALIETGATRQGVSTTGSPTYVLESLAGLLPVEP